MQMTLPSPPPATPAVEDAIAQLKVKSGPITRRLWRMGIAFGLAMLAFAVSRDVHHIQSPEQPISFGHDLLPSYVAGQLVLEGHASAMYDWQSVFELERRQIAEANLGIDPRYGPWLNPPFYAWAFVPLAKLPYREALATFVIFNLLLLGVSFYLLRGILVGAARAQIDPMSFVSHPAHSAWATGGLIPILLVVSMPFMQAFGHQQNTFITLVILCGVVTLWRRRQAFAAGMLAGLLAFKPQHAILIWVAVCLYLGWRALAGIASTGIVLFLLTIYTMPGCITDFLHKVPPIVSSLQTMSNYNWGRQVTFQSFWRLLLQRDQAGPTWQSLILVSRICCGGVAIAILAALWRSVRVNQLTASPDRIIAAIIVSAPLIMPYYMDYDLVLLVIPAVLFASECLADPQGVAQSDLYLIWAWVALFVVTYVNPGFAREFHFNLTAVALSVLAAMHIRRCFRDPLGMTAQNE
ncbi:MAG TPA: glycosyltransferase family 87 protein [Humisphaera sp.]|jgi:hypothetical protein|nr:glycosyltransferase family 87 protein [Humisphaera sp.]